MWCFSMLKKTKTQAERRKPDEQSRLFIETAREIGADEETSAADQVLGRLAKQQPEPRKPANQKK
jgi:hypothetical protein